MRRPPRRQGPWRRPWRAALFTGALVLSGAAGAAASALQAVDDEIADWEDAAEAVAKLVSDVDGSVALDALDGSGSFTVSASGSGDGADIVIPEEALALLQSAGSASLDRADEITINHLKAAIAAAARGSTSGSGEERSYNVGDEGGTGSLAGASSAPGAREERSYDVGDESSSASAAGSVSASGFRLSRGIFVGDTGSLSTDNSEVGVESTESPAPHQFTGGEERSYSVTETPAPSSTAPPPWMPWPWLAPSPTETPAPTFRAATPAPSASETQTTTPPPRTAAPATGDVSDLDELVARESSADASVAHDADSCDDEDCEVIRTFSLSISSNSGSYSSQSASDSDSDSDSDETTGSSIPTTTPYQSTFCRCKATECMNKYPGLSDSSVCVNTLTDGSCPLGYTSCVATDSYKVTTTLSTPNSMTDVNFILLAADIIGSFYNLGDEDPIARDADWWVAVTLPSGWRFVTMESTSVKVSLSEENLSLEGKVLSCKSILGASACSSSSSNRVGYVDIQSLLSGREDLMTSSSGAPISFSLLSSVVTGCSGSTGDLQISLTYKTSSGALSSTTTSRRMRELSVTTEGTTYESANMTALTLAAMDLPEIQAGRLDSSLIWVDEDTQALTLSFSTSTIIGPNSVDPKVCMDLRPSSCSSKGKMPSANVSFLDDWTAAYVKDGNPFIYLYGDPGETSLKVVAGNSTYFCVENLLPSGFQTNDSWEISAEFAFQIQITGVAWSGDESSNSTSSFQLPTLAAITLIDQESEMASDCAQILVHEKTYSKYALSVYSVMSVTIFAVGLAGAILITRMNGLSFSGSTFYNDMASVSIVIGFVLAIVANAIWISVSMDGSSASSSTQIYYLLHQIATCFLWTMMTAFCFHWSTVLFHDIRRSRRAMLLVLFFALNAIFYAFQLFGVVSLSDFYKCTYDDYIKNPLYTRLLCDSDFCPDLQPTQWKYSANDVCGDVDFSGWFFPLLFLGDYLLCVSGLALLVLGAFVLRRGARLMDQSGSLLEDRVVSIMRKSLLTYLVVIIAIAVVLTTSCIMKVVLYYSDSSINPVVWYIFTVWLPFLVPPAGFLVLQWNPRLHSMNGNSSIDVKEPTAALKDDKMVGDAALYGLLSDGWAGITRFPDTAYNPIGAESVDGSQNVLALSIQLSSPIPIAHACFVELYVADMSANDVTGEDDDVYFEELPVMGYHRASISSFIQSGIQRESALHRRSSLSTPIANTMLGSQWARVGFTETVLPTLLPAKSDGEPVTQIATFLSVLQIPVMPANPALRFVVYEIPEKGLSPASASSDRISVDPTLRLMRASSLQLDERARNSRVSGMGLSPPTKPRVFCEFTCSSSEMLSSNEVSLVAGQRTHRVFSDGTAESPGSNTDFSSPMLKVRSMTVATRTLKENKGFYISKCFQFAEGNDMVVEDMTESILTNEIPRQYLELLVTERAQDLARAKNDIANFEAKCRSGVMNAAFDNLIDQLQGENDQTVVHTWLEERVQKRKMYVDALSECHQVCIERADDGTNFKASTEKKSLVLRFLPINMHVQDMWVGPSAELRSQRSRRTSLSVKAYPTITVGAFAAHCYKFRSGSSIQSLRAKLQQRSLSRLQSDVSTDGNEEVDWSLPEVRATEETRWQLTTRLDMCVSQALSALTASFCRQLELAMQHPPERYFFKLINSVGFLFQVESLLSTQGKELGMLEDFSAAVDALKNVTFVLDTTPPSHLPPTLLNLHMKNTTLPSVVSVRLSKGAIKGAFTIVVGVRCSPELLALIPESLRTGGVISVTPIMFTQGINEMQTLANNASGKKTTLQDIINHKSFRMLNQYIEKYRQLAAQQPDAVPTDVALVNSLLSSLADRIEAASKQMMKTKHPKIIQESSRLCRLLGAGRVTSCKSAKDRTGMSVTLEQIQLLSEHHGLPQEFVIRTVSTMRSNGVRLENAFKNTGKRQYAFNALQRSLLPEEYRCPEGTYGRGNVS